MHNVEQSAFPLRPRLIDQVRDAICRKHYSLGTEQSYIHWIKRFIYSHDKRHPAEMGAAHVTAFLNHTATNGRECIENQDSTTVRKLRRHSRPRLKHSRAGYSGNPSGVCTLAEPLDLEAGFPSYVQWIPAFAGMTIEINDVTQDHAHIRALLTIA